jgi:YgiT-type zinc finger domain-containing protein
MICVICRQAESVDGLTLVTFSRGEFRLVVNRVPARVCPSCGDAYVEEEVAVRLLQRAEELYEEGSSESHAEYETG